MAVAAYGVFGAICGFAPGAVGGACLDLITITLLGTGITSVVRGVLVTGRDANGEKKAQCQGREEMLHVVFPFECGLCRGGPKQKGRFG